MRGALVIGPHCELNRLQAVRGNREIRHPSRLVPFGRDGSDAPLAAADEEKIGFDAGAAGFGIETARREAAQREHAGRVPAARMLKGGGAPPVGQSQLAERRRGGAQPLQDGLDRRPLSGRGCEARAQCVEQRL